MIKKLNLKVNGMTCASCEVLLERGMKKVPGVHNVQVSRSEEKATVHCDESVQLEDLQAAVAEKGYTLIPQDAIENPIRLPFIVKNKERLSEIGSVLVVLIGIYIILSQLDILPKNIGITDNMSYGFIFIIGLVAATSTCLAVAGGLLLAVANKYNEAYPHLTRTQKIKPHIWFNVGRIISYTFFGGVIGILGSALSISPKVTGIITVIASLIMIFTGIQLLQIFPWMNKIQLKMPKFIAHRVYDASHQETKKEPSKITSFFFGGSTFFLPCGFTQALQLYVLGKGDFAVGALTMLAFSLGTLPSLAGIGAVSSFAKGKTQRHFLTFSAVLVIILGLFNLPNGLALAGASISLGGSSVDVGENVKIVDGKQIVEMTIDGLDYYPYRFTVLQGIPVEWRIDGTKAEGCAQVVTVPKLGITEFMPRQGIKTIEFIPKEIGKISFSCTMGMTTPGAAFEVVPNSKGIKAAKLEVPEQGGCDLSKEGCDVQKVYMEVSREKGFYPNTHVVKKGVPVEMEIDTKIQLGGCMGTLVIPKYSVAHTLSLGKTILRFTPTETGIVPFTCSMGSHLGDFIVA